MLLTSVFGPYAQDDAYGSRAVNPMELYHNQVTRSQGVFSLRMFHRSWGLMLLQANVEAPCVLLDFPTRERFIAELRRHPFDVVGISSILSNVDKVAEMCRLVREHRPEAAIVVGGHIANDPTLAERIDADHLVNGEGVRWLRQYLGEDPSAPVRHPLVPSSVGAWTMGLPLSRHPRDTAAAVIPSVGCPMGCNFCSTSAMFGGRGRFINFYDDGDALFSILCGIEATTGTRSFFVMDENFLLHRRRALRLLELMRGAGKAWSLYVFSSANTLRLYTIEEIVGLGISWVWIGLEGKDSAYVKLRRSDTRELVSQLQAHGVRVLGSSIVGLPEHTPETIDQAIDYAVAHATEFHQFMLYTPLPGTPLHAEHAAAGNLLPEEECAAADAHGQARFNFRHPHIPPGRETEYLLQAFRRDFEVNGPSVLRIAETLLRGWQRHKHDADRRVRARYEAEAADLRTTMAGAVWAIARRYGRSSPVGRRARSLLGRLGREFGWSTRLLAPVIGGVVSAAMAREERRLRDGKAYEPPTFYDANAAWQALVRDRKAASCRWVAPPVPERRPEAREASGS